MCGLMFNVAGCIWREFSQAVLTSSICCPLNPSVSQGKKFNLLFTGCLIIHYSSSISSEFITLMKKVTKSPLVMDVINIAGVQKTLDRLADLLGKIQKALGEYLERERASFPRYVIM